MPRFALSTFCHFLDPPFFSERVFFDEVIRETSNFLEQTESNLLQINLPQSAGKSYFSTLLSAYLIGMVNKMAVLRITNTQSMADTFTEQTSAIIRGERFQMFFPDFPKLANDNKTEVKLEGNWNYSIRGVGADGTTMSKRANIIIIDDLYKSMGEALSGRVTRKLVGKWLTEWFGRIECSLTKVIVVGTPYAKNDFYEYLRKNMKLHKNVKFPALVNDVSFCEAVRSTDWLLNMRSSVSTEIWQAIYMMSPIADGKVMLFDNHEFNRWSEPMQFERVFTVTDPSFGIGGDFFTCGVFGIHKKTLVLTDLFFTRSMEYPDYFAFLKKYPTATNYIEKNGIGNLVIKAMNENSMRNVPFTTSGDKYERIYNEKEFIKNIVLPKELPTTATVQLVDYPDTDNDDFPDMLAHATRLFRAMI